MESSDIKAPNNQLAVTLTYFIALIIAWTGAWFLSTSLEANGILQPASFARLLYWTVLRVLLWFLPSLWLLRRAGKRLKDVLALKRLRKILIWGGGIGLILAVEITVTKLLRGERIFAWDLSWPLLNAVIIAPIVEEITFRGAVLEAFQTRLKFWPSNIVTGLLFMVIHFPGWYFQGVLVENILSPFSGALGILALGVLFGLAARQSKSVSAGIVTHLMNNLFVSM